MDLNDLRRAAAAARQFSHAIGAASFTLQVPTAYECEIAAHRAGMDGAENASTSVVIAKRLLLEQALVGWSGVTVGDVLPGHAEAADALEHSAGAAPLLLDAQPEWAAELWSELLLRIEARRAAKDAATKN